MSDADLNPSDALPRRPARGVSVLHREMVVPSSLEDTFAFFADAHNLDQITPPWIGFRILTPAPIAMHVGTCIDYRIRVRGVPLRWRTNITVWEPPHRFVDLQIRGPYRWWHHTHIFEPCSDGTRVVDIVEYRSPLWRLMHPLLVDRDVAGIFDYREHALKTALRRPSPAA